MSLINHRKIIADALAEQKLTRFGVAKLDRPMSLDIYREWLRLEHHGSMTYLREHLAYKETPALFWGSAEWAIVVAVDYVPHPTPKKFPLLDQTARYARGRDYHYLIKEKLNSVVEKLQDVYAGEKFVVATDSAPVLERDLAARAGLGWVGKNSCVINEKYGSFF